MRTQKTSPILCQMYTSTTIFWPLEERCVGEGGNGGGSYIFVSAFV